MAEDKTSGLQRNVARAALIREMCQTKGFEILREELEKKIKTVSRQMIDVTVDEQRALEFRKEGQVWVALHKLLGQIMLTGEISARNLNNLEPSADVKAE